MCSRLNTNRTGQNVLRLRASSNVSVSMGLGPHWEHFRFMQHIMFCVQFSLFFPLHTMLMFVGSCILCSLCSHRLATVCAIMYPNKNKCCLPCWMSFACTTHEYSHSACIKFELFWNSVKKMDFYTCGASAAERSSHSQRRTRIYSTCAATKWATKKRRLVQFISRLACACALNCFVHIPSYQHHKYIVHAVTHARPLRLGM